MGQFTPLMLALMQAQGQPMQPQAPTLGNLNLPTGPGQMQSGTSPLGSVTTQPTQVPGPAQPLPFEQQASPGVAGSQLAQQNQQAQNAGTLASALGASSAASAGSGAAAGGMSAGMANALPWLMALQYIQQQTAPPSIGGGRGGGYTESGGLF